MNEEPCDVGLIGLAVMGENLALNMERRGYSVCVHNRTTSRVRAFLEGRGQGRRFRGAGSPEELVAAVRRPRRVVLMVQAGAPVDALVERLAGVMDPGDVLIDAGNSLYTDTIRRTRAAESRGLLYVGCGVSGGEEGALRGPSLMPGGTPGAWPLVRPLFEAICARTAEGEACCRWMGQDGAGHFVKTVHNGIEYGDLQLIAEVYDVMRRGLRMTNDEMADVYERWNDTDLGSYLVEITHRILRYRDEHNRPLVDCILDSAGQKGTGKWTVAAALNEGTPLPLIAESVFARFLSASPGRAGAPDQLAPDIAPVHGEREQVLADLRQALYCARVVSYAQGYQLIQDAAATHDWSIDLAGVALTWRSGCIIRSAVLEDIRTAFERQPDLPNLLLDRSFAAAIRSREQGWRRAVVAAITAGVPVPCLSSGLACWDAYRAPRLPANLLQAQRDYFGAHRYERVDRPRGEFHHTEWNR